MILDGGLSNALVARGHDLADMLWTARLLRDAPQEIAAVHEAYYRAGAVVATSASYQASVAGFEKVGLSRAEAEALVRRSVGIAREVRDELTTTERPLLVAASVETIPDVDEAEVLVPLLDELGVPVWLSYSCAGTLTRAGQPLADAFAVAASSGSVVAVGVNCCSPEDVQGALEVARAVTGLPGVAYPNSGQGWDGGTHSWSGPTSYDVALAPGWVAAGASYVGGCCQVGPADIAALAEVLSR